ncbi:glycoside hydrolase family 92 protein [Dysgonomonas sp. 216]|uniref:GH92 family glycosyl hydrolase n=1 Tax=Dysgonomonas sp. 216 TaxID=2302934 RepID=UPI0013D10276|nr:GH92 family glycosyl hydrolase [Dysgonomonas sp. 216]NDW17620.1 glycoside hydrolase family 92 protein [Dysgonomonas sp. 216]
MTFRKQSLFVAFFLLVAFSAQAQTKKVTDYVNPFIGTGAVESSLSGNNYPGATSPFGMVQLSPDTRTEIDWDKNSGYDYNDKTILGFSHTHMSGTGLADFFDILFMPVVGNIDESTTDPSRFQSKYSHDQESASPGYYQVKLLDYDINAELTTTTRTGFHRYHYPKGKQARLIVNLNHSRKKGSWDTQIANAQIRQVDDYTIEGYRAITGWARLRKVYFYVKFSKPIVRNIMTDGGLIYRDSKVLNSRNMKGVFDFDTEDGKPLLAKIGISATSIANAKNNLNSEIAGWDFDKVKAAADAEWEKELGKIKIEGTEKQKTIFYTGLYHAFIQPNTMSDVNGDYMTTAFNNSNVSTSGKGVHYSLFSLWDTYRAVHPLYTLVQQDRTADFVKSMIRQYDTEGYLPVWQLWGQDNYCMIGNHAIPVVVDAVMKGIPGLDAEKAYEAVKNSSLTSHLNSPFEVWEKYGYMPENIQTQSVSITLEMAFDDWCVAQLAKKLGKQADYEHFIARSQYYRNLHNGQTKFFQSKDDKGNWIEPFDPLKYGANGGQPFTEGNAWQYYWYVPQDVKDLISLTGGDKAFLNKLDTFFTLTDNDGDVNHNASGFIGQYAHGNEPSHHVVYLYNYAGQPWKSQLYASQIMKDLYNTTSAGYAGNEDCGQMSAWYVFSAMGFYPVNPANGVYVIGSPLLEKAVIEVGNAKTFTVLAPKNTADDIYIQSVKLNGKKYDNTYILHQDIMNGGVLEFKMGKKPSKWGTKQQDRPD